MSIYTKTGDAGSTSLAKGKRILKSDLLIEALGSVDELSSLIGLIITMVKEPDNKSFLTKIQRNLQTIIIFISGGDGRLTGLEKELKQIEQKIDDINVQLPKLNSFILPQGSPLSCWFHILRTACRRTERTVVRSFNKETIEQPACRQASYSNGAINKYLNRLSDLFFVFARLYNKEKEVII